jgi:hypothetical protein
MIRKKFLITLLALIFPGVFWITNSVHAMPVGTLLYRTSRDGELYGYNTKNLLQLVDFSLKKGLETVKINCGHVGMYVGKIDGEDMVLEAIDNGVQLTPAKYFVNTREGEELVGARIPKKITVGNSNEINSLASIIGKIGLDYDWGFSDQKGPGSGQWICVGLAEKIYESLKPSLFNSPISTDNILQNLEYDPSKYAIDITPDGYDDASVYDGNTGDVLATNKEFSKIAQRDWEPSYILGKITDQGRYFFLPYTQMIQPTLATVTVDIPLSSDFESEEIRGKERMDKIIIVAINNTAVKRPLESAVNIYVALSVPSIFGLNNGMINYLAKTFNVSSYIKSLVADSSNIFNAASKSLPVIYQSDNTIKLNDLLGSSQASAAEEPAAAVINNSPAAVKVLPAAKIIAAKKNNKKINSSSGSVLGIKIVATSSLSVKVPPAASSSLEKIIEKISPVKNILPSSVSSKPVAAIENNNSSTTLSVKPEFNLAPLIKYFYIFDSLASSTVYSRKPNVDIKIEIENLNSVEKYSLAEASSSYSADQEIVWQDVLPINYNLSAGDGKKNIRLSLKYNGEQATSAAAEIFLDTLGPTADFVNLPEKSSTSTLVISWQGSDGSASSTSSGLADYEIQYARGPEAPIWQDWIVATSATSSIFSQATAPGDNIFFRVRAFDRAGNQGEWSQSRNVKIISSAINDLAVDNNFSSSSAVKLTWSAPEILNLPAAENYELRYAIKAQETDECDLLNNWQNAVPDENDILPNLSDASGTKETVIVTGLNQNSEYCFAIKNNFSGISNQVSGKTGVKVEFHHDFFNDNIGSYGQPSFYFLSRQNNIAAIAVLFYQCSAGLVNITLRDIEGNIIRSEDVMHPKRSYESSNREILYFSSPIPVKPGETYYFTFVGDVEYMDHGALTTFYYDPFTAPAAP